MTTTPAAGTDAEPSVIGYVGLGAMGGALAQRLLLTHDLLVYDQNPAAIDALAALGAQEAADIQEIAAQCDVIFLCLPTSEHVQDVVLGPNGLSEAMRPGAVLVDQTTGDPKLTRTIAAALNQRGSHWVDAPVSGGVQGAAAGTIAIMVGAEPDDFRRVAPILASMTPNVYHAGGIGAGHTMKLVNNVMSGAQRLLTFECIALATKNGIGLADAVTILLAGGARNAFLENVMQPAIVQGTSTPAFTLALSHKDVRLACQMGADSGVPMLLGSVTRELLQLCINAMGPDAKVDSAALVMERLADTHLVPPDHPLRYLATPPS